jgi:hypothetical protein
MSRIDRCDRCSSLDGKATRHFPHLSGTFGLEIVIMTNDQPSSQHHLCDSCLLDLMFLSVEKKLPEGTERAQRLRIVDSLEKETGDRMKRIARQQVSIEQEIERKQANLDEDTKALTERINAFDTKEKAVLEHNRVLVDQIAALHARLKTEIPQSFHNGFQSGVDSVDKDYGEAVERNMQRRLS